MPQIDLILEMLKSDLSAPKTLLKQVLSEINNQHGYTEERLPAFFTEKYPKLEDYEVDILFSPQWTPAEHNRLDYIPLLGEKAMSEEQVNRLKQDLEAENLTVLMATPDAQVEVSAAVHPVFIARYVGLLKLDQPLPAGIHNEIKTTVPPASHNEVNLLARDTVWQAPERTEILKAFLNVFKARNNFSTGKVSYLTNFIRTYRPEAMADLDRQFEALIESCRKDMESADTRGFHNQMLQEEALMDENQLVQPNAQDVRAQYQHMIDMAEQLQDDFRQIQTLAAAR